METLITTATWPPDYNIRLSHKAKRLYLRIVPNLGLEIVIPIRQHRRFNIQQVLIDHKEWVLANLSAFKIQQPEYVTSLNLRAINQNWELKYQATSSKQLRHIISPGIANHVLNLYGSIDDIPRTHIWLHNWLKQTAHQHLSPWLQNLSVQHDLPFSKVGIRGQTTLWGSCTADKNISLNYKLLFLPPELAQHIMLHELCHTKYLNHSAKFWNLLAQLDPLSKEHDYAIRKGEKYVPDWANRG